MAQQPAGAEFFQRRLQRAAAIPPAQRTPEVAGFVESVQLLHEARELLPFTADGRAALPDRPATWRQALLACCKLAQARCVCTITLPTEDQTLQHLVAYISYGRAFTFAGSSRGGTGSGSSSGSAGGSGSPVAERDRALRVSAAGFANIAGMQPLAKLMWLYASALLSLPAAQTELFQNIADDLAAPGIQRLIPGQLLQLAAGHQHAEQGQQPLMLTLRQLQFECWRGLLNAIANVFADQYEAEAADRLHTAQAAKLARGQAAAARAVLQLEPDSPRSPLLAIPALDPDLSSHSSVDMALRALRLAQQQGSNYWVVQAASMATMCASSCQSPMGPSGLAAVIAATQQAEAALRRCRRLLPESWVQCLECAMDSVRTLRPMLHTQLQLQQQAGNSIQPSEALGEFEALRSSSQATVHQVLQELDVADRQRCSGCGQQALGLRACSRCRKARYCSRECQVVHWSQHRHECRKE